MITRVNYGYNVTMTKNYIIPSFSFTKIIIESLPTTVHNNVHVIHIPEYLINTFKDEQCRHEYLLTINKN